jgi:hypothetical protein
MNPPPIMAAFITWVSIKILGERDQKRGAGGGASARA